MEFYDVPAKQAEKLVKDSRIKESLISYHDTYAFLKDVKDAQRQYIQLQVYDMEHLHLNALQLVKERSRAKRMKFCCRKALWKQAVPPGKLETV